MILEEADSWAAAWLKTQYEPPEGQKLQLKGEGFLMQIPVVLKDGKERLVSKDLFQGLIGARQILFFERTGGWVVVGRDRDSLRCQNKPYSGKDRRQ